MNGTFTIEYDSDLISKGHLVSPPDGSALVLKNYRITPLIKITGSFEDCIESRDMKTFFKLTYEWSTDSSDIEDEDEV